MKKIFTVIFGILCLFIFQVNVNALQTANNINSNPKPVLAKTQGLKVYIPPKDALSTTMKHAFMDWQKHTNGNFTFEFVGTKSTANIEVIFLESGLGNICRDGNALGCAKFSSATTKYGNKRILGAKIYISMVDNFGNKMTPNQLYTVMLHEIGHTLGLQHSNDRNSLMFAGTNSQMAEGQEIREDDIKTLYKLYGIK